jgi:cell cycle arrest protein BUB3
MQTSDFIGFFILQYTKYPTGISSLSFSRDGRLLAVAASYNYENGNKE